MSPDQEESIRETQSLIKERQNVFFEMEAYLPKKNGYGAPRLRVKRGVLLPARGLHPPSDGGRAQGSPGARGSWAVCSAACPLPLGGDAKHLCQSRCLAAPSGKQLGAHSRPRGLHGGMRGDGSAWQCCQLPGGRPS